MNINSRVIWSQVKSPRPTLNFVGFQAFEKTCLRFAYGLDQPDSIGLHSPVICQNVSEALGRHGVAPLGTSNEESLVSSLMILLEANSLVLHVEKCFVLTFGLHND